MERAARGGVRLPNGLDGLKAQLGASPGPTQSDSSFSLRCLKTTTSRVPFCFLLMLLAGVDTMRERASGQARLGKHTVLHRRETDARLDYQ